MKVTKIVEWDMGHRIPNHKSKCRNIHGHRYRAEVSICGELIDNPGSSDEGMVLDFGDIKQILMDEIHDPLDHGFMHYSEDKLCQKAFSAIDEEQKVIVSDFIPTAENLAFWIWKRINEKLTEKYHHRLYVSNVRLFETPTSWADYGCGIR